MTHQYDLPPLDLSRIQDLTDDEIIESARIVTVDSDPASVLDAAAVRGLKALKKINRHTAYVEWPNGIAAVIALENGRCAPNPTQLYTAYHCALVRQFVAANMEMQ